MEPSQESLKLYSVVADMGDGKTQTVSVRGHSPGDAFRQVKEMPGVRRVGKVTEGTASAPPQPARDTGHGRRAASPSTSTSPEAPAAPRPNVSREELLGFVLSGPKVVLHARPSGGEQPFKHLQAPPERPKPPVAAEPPKKPAAAAAAVQAEKAPQAAPAAARSEADGSPREYRILKSRRRDGDPYFLQCGRWQQSGGKRVFQIEWEKGFAAREAAERHRDEVERTGGAAANESGLQVA